MRHIYGDPVAHATLNLMQVDEDTWMVTGVEVLRRNRGQGAASKLLDTVLKEADQEGVTLVLKVEPDGTGLNEQQLADWYRRKGFTDWPRPSSGAYGMVRQPEVVA